MLKFNKYDSKTISVSPVCECSEDFVCGLNTLLTTS